MATPEERFNQLAGENQQLAAALTSLQAQFSQQAAVQTQLSQLTQALSGLPAAMAQTGGNQGRRTLLDQRGLGKPHSFNNEEREFHVWAQKLTNYIASVFTDVRSSLIWCIEQTVEIDLALVANNDAVLDDASVGEINEQLFIVLSSLTEGESFDVVSSAGAGCGYEAWRRLHRRWDPYTAGRARGLLRDILNPGRCAIKDLNGAIERLEDLMRR